MVYKYLIKINNGREFGSYKRAIRIVSNSVRNIINKINLQLDTDTRSNIDVVKR